MSLNYVTPSGAKKSYKYLQAPGPIMSADMAWHKTQGTSGEDYVIEGGCDVDTQMTKPCIDLIQIGDEWFSDGTYKQFYHGNMNGYKFSCYTCHCDDFVTVGDNYAGSTGLHIHILYFHGHQTQEWMQANRNTHGVTQAEIDAKCIPQSTAPTKTVKGYSFNECYGYHPTTGELGWFDIELYGSTQDDICFENGNLIKNSDGTYTLKSGEDGYVDGTKFRKIKTTFYTDGSKSTGSSSSSSAVTKYKRTHGSDQGYYKIDSKYMDGLTVKGTTSEKHPCMYSTDDKQYINTNVVGTTTMDKKY